MFFRFIPFSPILTNGRNRDGWGVLFFAIFLQKLRVCNFYDVQLNSTLERYDVNQYLKLRKFVKILKNIIFAVLLAIIAIACDKKKTNVVVKPKPLLTEHQMALILRDIYVAEGKVNYLKISRDSSKKLMEKVQVQIMDNYDIDTSIYKRNMEYYASNLRDLEKIYQEVLDSVNVMETNVKAKKGESGKGNDSGPPKNKKKP